MDYDSNYTQMLKVEAKPQTSFLKCQNLKTMKTPFEHYDTSICVNPSAEIYLYCLKFNSSLVGQELVNENYVNCSQN